MDLEGKGTGREARGQLGQQLRRERVQPRRCDLALDESQSAAGQPSQRRGRQRAAGGESLVAVGRRKGAKAADDLFQRPAGTIRSARFSSESKKKKISRRQSASAVRAGGRSPFCEGRRRPPASAPLSFPPSASPTPVTSPSSQTPQEWPRASSLPARPVRGLRVEAVQVPLLGSWTAGEGSLRRRPLVGLSFSRVVPDG